MSETIKHAGLIIRLEHDHDCESPLEHECQPRFAMWHRRRNNPAPEYASPDDVRAAVKKGAVALPVRAYEHSLISFTVSDFGYPYNDPWDSAWAGYVVFTKEIMKDLGVKKKDAARLTEIAQSAMEEYTEWCNGECYYFVIENAVGDTLDSCGGFIGYDYALETAKEAADACAEQEAKRMKAYTAIKLDEDGDEEEHLVSAVSMADALRQLDFDPIKLYRNEEAA